MIDFGAGVIVYQVHPEDEPGKSELYVINSRTTEQQNVVKTKFSGKWYTEQEYDAVVTQLQYHKDALNKLQSGLIAIADHNARALEEVKNGA